MYFTLLFSVRTWSGAYTPIDFPHANPVRGKEAPETLSELRRLLVSKIIKSDVDGDVGAGDESQGVTASFVDVDQNYDAILWEVFQKF